MESLKRDLRSFELAYFVWKYIHYHCFSALCFRFWTMTQFLKSSWKIILWRWNKKQDKRRENLNWQFVINSENLILYVKTNASTFWQETRTTLKIPLYLLNVLQVTVLKTNSFLSKVHNSIGMDFACLSKDI